jgi:hypothetical protein
MSLKLLTDLVVLLLVLGMTAIALLGWGNLTWRLLGIEQPNKPSVITVWLGFCIVVGCIEIIHLFVPIDWKVTFAFALIGLIGYWLHSKSLFSIKDNQLTDVLCRSGILPVFFSAFRRYPLRSLVAAIVVVVWCLRAMDVPTMYDSGLYHFGSIRWANEYPIVPGLGNLHWRLALNQSYFGFLALLNFAPHWGKGYATGGLFLLLLTAATLLEIGLAQSRLWRWIFGGILFSYLCLLSGPIANPMPDTAMALLEVVIFIFLYQITLAPVNMPLTQTRHYERVQLVLMFLGLTIMTIKLSSVGFALASMTLVAISIVRFRHSYLSVSAILKAMGFIGLFVFVHVSRGYLSSGAPFFPSPVGGLWLLPWAVEPGVAHYETQLIYAWAKRASVESLSYFPQGFEWVRSWLLMLPPTMKCLFVASSLLLLLALILRRTFAGMQGSLILLGSPVITALLFWFFTAPDPRFLGAVNILYFVWSLLLLQQSKFSDVFRGKAKQHIEGLTRLVVLSVSLFLFVRWSVVQPLTSLGWRPLPASETILQSNRSGFSAFVPSSTGQCWNSELPCAVLLHDGLRLEQLAGPNLNGGFLFDRKFFLLEK